MNTMSQKKAGRKWTSKSPNSVMKTEIDYILTNKTDIVTDVTVINQVNIGSDHRMAMRNIKLVVGVERKTVRLELRNRFETLQELDDIDTMCETITDMTPKRRVQSSEGNQQATEIEDIVTSMSTDDETTRNGEKTATMNNE